MSLLLFHLKPSNSISHTRTHTLNEMTKGKKINIYNNLPAINRNNDMINIKKERLHTYANVCLTYGKKKLLIKLT